MSDQDRIKINQAIEKITKEANSHEGKPDYGLFLHISEIVIERIYTDADADVVLRDDRTLAGAEEKIASAFRKAKSECKFYSDADGDSAALEYFGLAAKIASPAVSVIDVGDLI